MAADLGRNTYVRQREGPLYLLMLADSELQEECNQSWNWVMVGKAKKMGGVKQVSNPHVRKNDNICLPL